MEVPVVRDELVAALEESLRLTERLTADARDRDVPVAELVAKATMLNRLTERREELLGELRRTASAGARASGAVQPIRKVVLEILDQLGGPQNAGFLEDYLWATRQLQLESRSFSSLRRDERRAWDRTAGARDAYIVPALNADGTANPRWLTSSAWDLSRRLVVSSRTERLFDLQKIVALRVTGSRGPLGTLLERNAVQVLGMEPPAVSATDSVTRSWRRCVRTRAATEMESLRATDDAEREQAAAGLAGLSPAERAWGREGA